MFRSVVEHNERQRRHFCQASGLSEIVCRSRFPRAWHGQEFDDKCDECFGNAPVQQVDSLGSRVVPLTDEGDLWQRHFRNADMVIEAVPEDLGLKHRYSLERDSSLDSSSILP